jgi:hypothetical protein
MSNLVWASTRCHALLGLDDGTLLALTEYMHRVKIQENIHATSSGFVPSPQNVQSILKIWFLIQYM